MQATTGPSNQFKSLRKMRSTAAGQRNNSKLAKLDSQKILMKKCSRVSTGSILTWLTNWICKTWLLKKIRRLNPSRTIMMIRTTKLCAAKTRSTVVQPAASAAPATISRMNTTKIRRRNNHYNLTIIRNEFSLSHNHWSSLYPYLHFMTRQSVHFEPHMTRKIVWTSWDSIGLIKYEHTISLALIFATEGFITSD